MATVQFVGINKSYDGKQSVIPSFDLSVRDGEFVVLVGPSGCGKSTLLRMLAGLESISGGQILVDDVAIQDLAPRHRDLAMVFQDYALYPHKTLYENMAFGLRVRKTPEADIKTSVMEAAKLLKIEHILDRKPAALSGGQRQRVAIGRAIVRKPKVFLFDEPLSNLDAQLRGEMRVEIKRLHQRLGATIIYVTHDQVEAMTLADRIVVLNGGHKEQEGTPSEIYNRPKSIFVAKFTGSPAMNVVPFTKLPAELQALLNQSFRLPTAIDTMGIRSENMLLARSHESDITALGKLVLCEPLGAETLVTVQIGSAEFIMRGPANFVENAKAGATLEVFLPLSKLHFFNSTTGDSL